VFTNGDRIHASRALKRLGIEDCFERIVCFETLNPTSPTPSDKLEIFDIVKHLAHPQPGVELPKSPILCKPSREAMLQALEVASINPHTTVSSYLLTESYLVFIRTQLYVYTVMPWCTSN
jgi:phosphoglycolate phosphatase-like HAD superfamily hydrolase